MDPPSWLVADFGALLLTVIGRWARIGGARRDDRRTILIGLTILAIAFFVLPTRVHERYLFPFFALGAILAATSFRWRLAYFALALANFANLSRATHHRPLQQSPISDLAGYGRRDPIPGSVMIAPP